MAWTWLEKMGHDIVAVFEKAAPIVEEAQVVATPFENLFAPGLSTIINAAVTEITKAEALAANAAAGANTGPLKLATVVSSLIPQIAPTLATMGVQSVSSTQYNNFVSALVSALNAFETTEGPATSGTP